MALQDVFSAEAVKLPDEKAVQLLTAVAAADRKAVRKLLEEGVSPNVRDVDGNTPLMVAAGIPGNLTIAGMLLGRGAEVNATNKKGEAALHAAAGEDMMRLLLASNADPLVITDAARRETLLFMSVTAGSETAVDALLGAGVKPTVKNVNNETLLYLAAFGGDVKMVNKMIGLGLSPNDCTNKGFSPLRAAMRNQNPALEAQYLDCIKALAAADADPSIEVNDRSGWNDNTHTDIGYAQFLGGEIAALVVEAQKKFQVNDYARRGQGDKVIELVTQGVKCDAVNKEGYTALQYSTQKWMPEATAALIAAGADPNRPTPNGELPLAMAADYGAPATVAALAAGGADVNAIGPNGIHALHAALGGNVDARRGDTVKALLDAKANPDLPTAAGEYPLAVAAKNGDADSVKYLLDANANTALFLAGGLYPLHLAVQSGNFECVRLLIASGASTFVKDDKGYTPFDYAAADKHKKEKIFDAIEGRRDAELNHWAEDSVRTNGSTSGMKTLKFKPKAPT